MLTECFIEITQSFKTAYHCFGFYCIIYINQPCRDLLWCGVAVD